ncbi:hypothetical protein ACSBR2_028263 [Camellia fascicularis]
MAEESTLDFGIEEKDDREELGDFVRGESDYDDFGDGKRKKFEKDGIGGTLLPTSYLRASVSAAVVSSSIQELGTDIEKHHEGKLGPQMSHQNGNRSLVGDLFGLLSAVTYGLFTVLLKKFSGEKGERVDVQKLSGYIGLFTLIALWWLGQITIFLYANNSIVAHPRVHYEESDEESSEMESVYALKCHISHEVNHLHEGLKHVLSGEVGGQAPRRTKTLTLREVLCKSLNAWIMGGPSI